MSTCAAKQSRFVLPIADDVRLVTVDTARACSGETAELITERYEDSKAADHLPAFDLSIEQNKRREPRIWAGALRGSSITDLDAIIADCLLTNVTGLANQTFHLRASQLERAWCVSNQTILQFIKQGLITGVRVGRNWKLNRASAAAFLKGRAI